MRKQLYIDPVYVLHNVMKARLIWDTHTYMTVRFEFDKLVKGDRFKMISFVTEYLRKSGIDFFMTKQEFINIQLSDFPKVKVKIEDIVF